MSEPQNGRIGGGVLKDNLKIYEDNSGKDFLNFKNEISDTALLHIDALNKRIAIKKDVSIPDKALAVDDKLQSVNSISEVIDVFPYFNFQTNEINLNDDILYLNAQENIQLSALATTDILINNNIISTYNSDADIDLIPSGTGSVEILSNIDVYGSIHATGNISMGGDLIFGQGPETPDQISFGTVIASDIIPDLNNTYNIGSPTKQVGTIYSNLLNGQGISAESLISGFVDLALRQGNIFYVAETGDDTNVGDHPQGPFKTIKRALQAADASNGGPVTIHIFPGGYEEELPLVVPSNVTIHGQDLRNVIIRPESAYQSEDVFHITGEVTIENITIKDFYYDNINDTGYAFRFAPGAIVSTRSPYIRNITVITNGSTTSPSDPRGFASGDAGKGAYIDGAAVNSLSNEASVLFHAATFITPGVDCITMTNGVRIEWLNSFTYYANRGLYALQGTGRTLPDGSTLAFGAEIRSIGSANVYGNYGAWADGANCIMYLINHNFAYIGVGKETDNDRDEVIESQQWIELNSGKVYVQNTDERGKFKVGDDFFVDFDLGTISIDTSQVDLDGLSQIVITDGTNTTTLNTNFVETGNIRFDGNTIFSTSGNIEIDSIVGNIDFLNNVNIAKDLDITGDLTIDGTLITFGDSPNDVLDFNVPIDQNFYSKTTNVHSLGSATKLWNNIYTDDSNIDNIRIFDNVITTTLSNANLDLKSNANGYVQLEGLEFQNDTVKTVSSNIELTMSNNLYFNGQGLRVPVGTNVQRVETAGSLRFSSTDTVFEGWGTNRISFSGVYSSDRRTSVVANKTNNFINFNVNNIKVGELNREGLTINGLESDSIFIDNNTIRTVDSNADLFIRRKGSGQIKFNGQEYFRDNIWTNPETTALTFRNTNRGYVKVVGTKGIIVGVSGQYIFDNVNDLSIGTDVSGSNIWATDNGVRIDQGISSPSGNGTIETTGSQVIGSTSTGLQSYFIDFGISDITNVIEIEITQVRFRGNFQDTNEYVDLILPTDNTGTYTTRIGEFEDNGDTNVYTVSLNFGNNSQDARTYSNTGAEATDFTNQVTVGLSGNYGLAADVDVPATLNTLIPGMTNNWELEISYKIVTSNNQFSQYDVSTNNYYYIFDEDTSNLIDTDRYVVTNALNLPYLTRARIRGKLILGNNNNGSREYLGSNIILQFSDDGTNDTGMQNLATILNINNKASYTIWNEFDVIFDIEDSSIDLTNLKFRIVQPNGGEKGANAFAISELQLFLSETVPDSKPVGTFRYDAAAKQAEVWDGSQWVPATGFEVDPVTADLMEEIVGIWSLIVG